MAETIGVDVGGTKVAVAALRGGELGPRTLAPTTHSDADALLDAIAAAVEGLLTPATSAVGVGVPSVIDFAAGRARSSVNVPFTDLPLRELLSERVGLPVFVDNDATLAALAEASDGERIVVENLVMLTVGTGVGGGLVLGGRLYRGATGAAGEIGHMIVSAADWAPAGSAAGDGPFPKPGSLESLAAGRVLDRLAAEAAERQPESALGRILAAGRRPGGADAVAAAAAGDDAASEAVARLGSWLGIGIANAINLLDPDEVVIGGGASTAGELLLGPARRSAAAHVLPGVGTGTEIRLARSGADAGVLGAALLAAEELRPDR